MSEYRGVEGLVGGILLKGDAVLRGKEGNAASRSMIIGDPQRG